MKNKIMTYIFIIFISTIMILSILIKDNEVSYTERRHLTLFKMPNVEEIFNGTYGEKLEKYFLDQFPLRDKLRSIKAFTNYKIFKKTENNNIYIKDNYIYKSNYPTNEKSINNFIDHINTTKSYLTKDNNAYLVVVPDKNYYLDSKDFLNIDYNYIEKRLDEIDINTINLKDTLTINDYYETDTHWKQQNLNKSVSKILKNLNIKEVNIDYNTHTYNNFRGVYYGESAISRKPETITYLTSKTIDRAKVKYLENKNLTTVYNKNKLNNFDSYEVYLDGASSFIEIKNNNSKSDKELVIFRDSFGSSITPLLIEYYNKITLIDNRYINSKNYLDLVEFNKQDVLFIYSTLIINNSFTIKN